MQNIYFYSKKGEGWAGSAPHPHPKTAFEGAPRAARGQGDTAGSASPSPPTPRGRFFWHRKINGSALGPAIPGGEGGGGATQTFGEPGEGLRGPFPGWGSVLTGLKHPSHGGGARRGPARSLAPRGQPVPMCRAGTPPPPGLRPSLEKGHL